ncbi:MAG: acyl-CoA dehydratase activase-related protein, partial [Elusimicrobia bacterium]|nr:acyl-CoA dehydratase activase-related protein [Elusimicrobiota bacterium]
SNLLGRDVRVHPYNRLSGAIGAALIAREMYARKPFATSFVGLAGGGEYQLSGFECRVCSNRCQVNKIVRDGETAFFGDVCERYTSRSVGGPGRERRADLADERDRLMVERGTRAVGAPPADESVIGRLRARYGSAPAEGKEERPRVIGIPRASLYFELFPLWAAMFKSLGCEVVVSEPSSQELLTRGIKRLSTEACLPMKLAISHSLDLADKKVDHIFLPSIMDLPAPFGYPDQCSTCPYTQTMPYLIKAAVQASFLVPQIDMSAESYGIPEGLEELCAPLGVSWARLRAAYQSGKEAYLEFKESLLKRGDELTASGFEWAVVLIGKPYNLYDPFLNTNLVQHLSRMGILAIPYEFLARSGKESLDASWDSLPWRFNRDYIKVALKVREDRRLYPIVVSNFGCGPDAFTIKHLEKIFAGRPALCTGARRGW